MLLSFKCDNFKSFSDGFEFRMIPEKRLTELKHSVIHKIIDGHNTDALSASVLYGPNAAGKTSVVNAMSCLRNIVLRGNIQNSEDDRSGDHVSRDMNLVPFAYQTDKRPICFDVSFTFNNTKYQYVLGFYVGMFLEKSVERYIERETLYVNDKMVFNRSKNSVEFLELKHITQYLNSSSNNLQPEAIQQAMSENMVSDSLLLTTDFNSFCSKKIVAEMIKWFKSQFIIINSANKARFYPSKAVEDGFVLVDEYINRIAKEAGIIGSDYAYIRDPDLHSVKLVSVIKHDKETYGVESDLIESVGTIRLISVMPAILGALQSGAILVADELDASLHPMIIMNLISIFHNDSVNKNGAQLVFNTHNPIYLNHRLLRRDEIKFVERDKETKASCLYSLSDFRANGEVSVRKTTDYMKNYFVNRYGAIEDIDFTDIVDKVLNGVIDNAENSN